MKEHNIPALYGLDTRALTKKIRVRGAMLDKICFGDEDIKLEDPNQRNLVAEVLFVCVFACGVFVFARGLCVYLALCLCGSVFVLLPRKLLRCQVVNSEANQ